MHYIIVVHGIGEQRKNETVLNVVNRFAEASRGLSKGELSGILTLGKATGQTGKEKLYRAANNTPNRNATPPWLEFRGIPQPELKDTNPKQYTYLNNIPFYGEDVPENEKGQNIRFVDLCWSDIMQDNAKQVCQPVEDWAKGLLGRLNLKNKHANEVKDLLNTPEHHNDADLENRLNQCKSALVPYWIIKILSTLVEALILIRRLMSFRFKEMEELVFTKFLGDVQLYGEYPIVRGSAVRRFHRLFARIEKEHKVEMEEQGQPYTNKPTYTIIAHSLGTIMSLDALLYALVDPSIRTAQKPSKSPNLPFPGYYTEKDISTENNVNFTNTRWIKRVQSFVTLGSPIDKYLVMWWLNYRYLLEPDKWKNSIKANIKHFNYSDELDPVGHNLDIVQQTRGYKDLFKKEIDVVFNRYSIFGAAHNKYWADNELFNVIFSNTVNKKDDDGLFEKVSRFKPKEYLRLLSTTYFFIPFVLSAIAAMSFDWAFLAEPSHTLQTKAMACLLLIITLLLGSKLIKITILGRQIQRIKARGAEKGAKEKLIRNCAGWSIWLILIVLPLVLAYYALVGFNAETIAFLGWDKLSLLFSIKWFVAITYAYLAYNFFSSKIKLTRTRKNIEDYEKFSEDPIK